MDKIWEIIEHNRRKEGKDSGMESYRMGRRMGISGRKENSEYKEAFEEGFECALAVIKKYVKAVKEEMFSDED